MVSDLTGLPIANASLLDEGTAAAEAMLMSWQSARSKKKVYVVDENCHPQTIACLKLRAEAFNIEIVVANVLQYHFEENKKNLCGVLLQVKQRKKKEGRGEICRRMKVLICFCPKLVSQYPWLRS